MDNRTTQPTNQSPESGLGANIWRYYWRDPVSYFPTYLKILLFLTSALIIWKYWWRNPVCYFLFWKEKPISLLEMSRILQHSLGRISLRTSLYLAALSWICRISLLVPKRSSRLGQVWLFLPLLILHCWIIILCNAHLRLDPGVDGNQYPEIETIGRNLLDNISQVDNSQNWG